MNNKDLIDKILKASNIINKKSRSSSASYIFFAGSEISKSEKIIKILKGIEIVNYFFILSLYLL
jgi:hypothetical protein